jgi:hypothetical protein
MNDPTTAATVRRAAADFAIGVLVFGLVAACVAVTEGQAATGTAPTGWVTTVHYASEPSLFARVANWHTGATTLLALTFGALTAFNLSLARHVRTVAVAAPAVSPNQPRPNL